MKTKIIKSQKPISLDVHLKYRCPNDECGYTHWLSLLETQTKNFKVVCDCGTVFKPKLINNIKLVYKKKDKKQQPLEPTEQKSEPTIDIDIINRAIPSLMALGFDKEEASTILTKTYSKQPTDNLSLLIKNTLLELKNNG